MTVPAGCKNVKLNLDNAYRTTFTHIVAGDEIRVEFMKTDGKTLIPSATHAPKRSMWVRVIGVKKDMFGYVSLHVDYGYAQTKIMDFVPAQTAVTRKARPEELAPVEETSVTMQNDEEANLQLIAVKYAALVDALTALDIEATADVAKTGTDRAFAAAAMMSKVMRAVDKVAALG